MSKESLIEEVTHKDGPFQRMCLFSDTSVVNLINKHLPDESDEPDEINDGDYVVGHPVDGGLLSGIVDNANPDEDGDIEVEGYWVNIEKCRLATTEEREFLNNIKI